MATTNFASPRKVCRLIPALVLGLAAASSACSTPAPGVSGPEDGAVPMPSVADAGVLPSRVPGLSGAGGSGDGGVFVTNVSTPLVFDTAVSAVDPPPAISGGTLAI